MRSKAWQSLAATWFTVFAGGQLLANPSDTGQWGPILQGSTWPAIRAVHMILLHNGKVLIIDERREVDELGNTIIIGQYAVYDPTYGTFTPVLDMPLIPDSPNYLDLECAGHCQLADGKVIFYGGRVWMRQKTVIYDPLMEGTPSGPWTQLIEEPGNRHRFYPTLTLLSDGRVLNMAGRISNIDENVPEIFDPNAPLGQQWSELSGAAYRRLVGNADSPCPQEGDQDYVIGQPFQTPRISLSGGVYDFHIYWYPYMFQLSTGKLLYAAEDVNPVEPVLGIPLKTRLLNVAAQSWEEIVTSNDPIRGGSAVMFRPDKVIKAAGARATPFGCPTDGQDIEYPTDVYRLNAATQTPQWEAIDSLSHPRSDFYLVALADGSVLTLGGKTIDFHDPLNHNDDEALPVYTPELLKRPDHPWVPANPILGTTWQDMATMSERRGYHSSALLLPDGRVLIAGGEDRGAHPPGTCPSGQPCPQKTAQIFSPPYLFAPGGGLAVRPVIERVLGPGNGVNVAWYGHNFTVLTPDASNIREVSLIRLGAATHSFDQDQRFVPLIWYYCGLNAISVAVPANSNKAPPGHYMLFLINADGTPSVSRIVQILPEPAVQNSCSQPLAFAEGCRYLTVDPGTGDCPVAIWVEHEPWHQFCLAKFVQSDGSLDWLPYFKTRSDWGEVHITDPEIVPDQSYKIRIENCIGDSWEQVVTTRSWCDTYPAGGDGLVDVDDITCALDAFAGIFFPPNCTPRSTDLMLCTPDGLIDVEDILAVLDAYSGLPFPCTGACSGGGSGMAPEGSFGGGLLESEPCEAVISLAADQEAIAAGDWVTVEVRLTSSAATRAYQIALEVAGGDAGELTLVDITIEEERPDYLFYGPYCVHSEDETQSRAVAALTDGTAAATSGAYIATFTFQASVDASGEFTVSVQPAQTLLSDQQGNECQGAIAAAVTVKIQ